MHWLELTLRLTADACPKAETLLELSGALSITITDDGDSPILEPETGTTPLWPKLTLRAIFDEDVASDAVKRLLEPVVGTDLEFARVSDAPEAAAEAIHPIEVGPTLRIVPAEAMDPTDEHSLGLHMGLAFGTGRHPTTLLCLKWIEQEKPAGLTVLDYGAGSGVLALAALRLGADSAVAIDNEPQALISTRENARLNDLADRIQTGAPDDLDGGSFDLILANILARPLIERAEMFARMQEPGGRIALSGILVSQLDEVEAAFADFYRDFARSQLDGWGLLTARRSTEYDR